MRWQMSPFAVAQCASVIQGKLMFEEEACRGGCAERASGILSSASTTSSAVPTAAGCDSARDREGRGQAP